MSSSIKNIIRDLLRLAGYDLIRYHTAFHSRAARMTLLKSVGINTIYDVGANTGQFAEEMRRDGFRGKIVSFEPLSSAFRVLQKRSMGDPQWTVVNLALGQTNQKTKINISGNSLSSSLLDMLPRHRESAPESSYTDSEEVNLATLDAVFHEYFKPGDKIFLKVDTQGYEKFVIEGAAKSLENILAVQLELSLVSLYKGETLFTEMFEYMRDRSFKLMSIDPAYRDPLTGQLLQVDTIFFKEN